MDGGDLSGDLQQKLREALDEWGNLVQATLGALDLPPYASPIFRPWNLIAVVDAQKAIVVFTTLTGGTARLQWIDQPNAIVTPEAVRNQVHEELGQSVCATFVISRAALDGEHRGLALAEAAALHAQEVERDNRLKRLGNLEGLAALEVYLRRFLEDHPNPERNVFIMMRFMETPQLAAISTTIKSTLAEKGFEGLRADDRDYTGDLWSNVETYLVGCQLGIAVFEDIDKRDFNPNVSLELGYMMGRQRRFLILKEKRLPELPADVVHKLYKPFDAFDIEASVRSQVLRWVEVDLGHK